MKSPIAENSNLSLQSAMAFALAMVIGTFAPGAFAEPLPEGYVQAPVSGVVVKDPFGLCWRTGYWTPAMATKECDPELLPKPEPAPVAVVPPAPAPAPMAPKPVEEKVKLSAETLFAFDKSTLRSEGKEKLDDLVSKLQAINVETIIDIGYTDRIGSKTYNLKLSQRRAEAVKAYLVSKGIPANRILAEGKGKADPVTKPGECKGPISRKLIKCLQPDRRVEIDVVGTRTQ
ncbi:MAG TPA: OmpA family protein [Burkholderiales bacterium]|nr:OmpA family protein [Burkholderiales bacterium]